MGRRKFAIKIITLRATILIQISSYFRPGMPYHGGGVGGGRETLGPDHGGEGVFRMTMGWGGGRGHSEP